MEKPASEELSAKVPDVTGDVPDAVFKTFLGALEEAGIKKELISRLRTTLLDKKDISEKSIRSALFPEELDL